jgi:hypothetical protein
MMGEEEGMEEECRVPRWIASSPDREVLNGRA